MAGVVSFVVGVLGALVRYVGFFFAYRTGVRREKQRQAEEAVKVKDEQLEIAARPVEHRSDLLKRLRDGGL